jgi:hypothetical protein
MGGFNQSQLVEAFHISSRYIPVMLISVGVGAQPSGRFTVEDTIVWNQF